MVHSKVQKQDKIVKKKHHSLKKIPLQVGGRAEDKTRQKNKRNPSNI